jgi:hypothetical protein
MENGDMSMTNVNSRTLYVDVDFLSSYGGRSVEVTLCYKLYALFLVGLT